MTFHHLVRDELNALESGLLQLYDQYALINLLQYWRAQATLVLGWPPRFWRQAATESNHPFFGHLLLSKYGGMLAEAGRQRDLERCKEKAVTGLPLAFLVPDGVSRPPPARVGGASSATTGSACQRDSINGLGNSAREAGRRADR